MERPVQPAELPKRLDAASLAILRREQPSWEPALVHARRLKDCDTGRFPVDWSGEPWSTPLPDVQYVRSAVTLLGWDTEIACKVEDNERVLADVLRASTPRERQAGEDCDR